MATDYEALARQFGGQAAGPAPTPAPAPAPAAAARPAPVAAPVPAPAAPAVAPVAAPTAAAPATDFAALAAQFGGQAAQQPSTTLTGLAGAATRGLALPAAGAALGAMAGAPLAGVGAIPGAVAGAGAATLAQVVGDPIVSTINSLFGTQYTLPTDAMADLLTRVGVAQPRTEAERIVQATAAGAGVAGGTVAAGRAIQAAAGQAAPVTREVGRMLASQPGLQVAGGAGAGAAGQTAQEMGAGPVGQVAATIAGAMAPVGVAAAVPAVRRAVTRQPAARRPAARPAPPAERVEPTMEPEVPPASAVAAPPTGAPIGAAMPEPVAPAVAPAAPAAAAEAAEAGVSDILNLARKAGGIGPGSTAAKAKLVDLAQVNPEARAAAERLNIELPFDVFSDNPQVRSAVGLTRALAGGEAEAAWEGTVRAAVQRADEISQQFDAAFIEGRPSTAATSQKILDSLKSTRNNVQQEASDLYKQVDAEVPKSFPASTDNLAAELAKIKEELGASAAGIKSLKKLDDMVNSGMTYGGVSFEKSMLGAAKRAGTTNEYATNLNTGTIKRLEAAIAKDQLDTVEAFGGEEIRRKLRTANLLTAKQKALEERLVGAFGKDIDGSVAQRMQTAITTASKGDAAAFNRLMKVVPEDLRKETLATALASVTAGKAAGRAVGAAETVFSPAEYTKVYRGLRANPPVYAQMVKIMGPEWDRAARDLYEVSKRIADANARIPATGKANQILGEAAVEGLMGKIMSSSLTQRITTGAVSLVPGGGLIAPDIVNWMTATKGAGVQKASKLFASPEFQEFAVQTATQAGQPSQAALRRTAMSKAFGDFAKAAKLPQSLDARVQWLQSAVQSGRQFNQEQEQ